jgi:hypothetical protein
MRATIKSWAVLLRVTMSLCVSALAGCTVLSFNGPTLRNDTLQAVSCLSANSCVAVGTEVTVIGQGQFPAPVAMRWDGSRWHTLAVRLPSGAVQATLSSVSCNPGGCLAVGGYAPAAGAGSFALAEYWNDSTWTPVTLAFPPGPSSPSLRAVSCVTAGQCVAAGDYENASGFASPLAATWDGHEWSWSRPPVRTGVESNPGLVSVSCVTARYCVAIGDANDHRRGSAVGFTEIWNGHGWTQAYASVPGGTGSLSCAAASYCLAVGTQFAAPATGFGQLLDGTHWAEQAMPWPRGTPTYLYGVSCAGKACLAVGGAGVPEAAKGIVIQPAALTWNGATWTQSPAQATASGTTGILFGVTCVTAADCVAVGNAGGHNGTRNLSEFWNGTAWTVNPT